MKNIFENGRKLPLIDEFYTIQGEGFHAGKAAYFIRIGGCDAGCLWCDAKITWKANLHKLAKTDDIIKNASNIAAKTLVVTGGEPLLYELDYLCDEAHKKGMKVYLETAGTHKLTGKWDWICLSPKKQSPPLQDIYKFANELKIIINDISDFDWAEYCAEKVEHKCRLYMQPEWSNHKTNADRIVKYIKDKTKWRISIQIHKFLKIP